MDIQKIGIVGAGQMGNGIAHVSAQSGIEVVLHDLEQAAEVADEVVLLVHGRIIATGTPTEVLTAERLSAAYEVPIDVEPLAEGLRIRPQRLRRRLTVSRAA